MSQLSSSPLDAEVVQCRDRHVHLLGELPLKDLFSHPLKDLLPAFLARAQGIAGNGLTNDMGKLMAAARMLGSTLGDASLADIATKSASDFSPQQIRAIFAAKRAGLGVPVPTADEAERATRSEALRGLLAAAPEVRLGPLLTGTSVIAPDLMHAAAASGALPAKPPQPPQSTPTLVQCSVEFHTNDEDKDGDTHVSIDVVDGNQFTCASTSNDFGHFDDNSEEGPYTLEVENPSTFLDLQRGTVRIRIDPNGHDTWRFNFILRLKFSDNSEYFLQQDGLQLTQNSRQESFGLMGIVRSS